MTQRSMRSPISSVSCATAWGQEFRLSLTIAFLRIKNSDEWCAIHCHALLLQDKKLDMASLKIMKNPKQALRTWQCLWILVVLNHKSRSVIVSQCPHLNCQRWHPWWKMLLHQDAPSGKSESISLIISRSRSFRVSWAPLHLAEAGSIVVRPWNHPNDRCWLEGNFIQVESLSFWVLHSDQSDGCWHHKGNAWAQKVWPRAAGNGSNIFSIIQYNIQPKCPPPAYSQTVANHIHRHLSTESRDSGAKPDTNCLPCPMERPSFPSKVLSMFFFHSLDLLE